MNENIDHAKPLREVTADPCSSLPSTLPKKGILKRCSHLTEHSKDDQSFLTQRHRSSPDRFPEKSVTRIPKLSLTWSEKNAVSVFGDTTSEDYTTETDDLALSSGQNIDSLRQTAILSDDDDEAVSGDEKSDAVDGCSEYDNDRGVESEEEDDVSTCDSSSVKNDGSNSHIVGKWWFGRSTKFVPHCAKWGCKHNHSGCDNNTYLTPTQKLTKNISGLKMHLKSSNDENKQLQGKIQDKDNYIAELRDRLKNLEGIISSSSGLSDLIQQLNRQKEIIVNLEREKKSLLEKHEIRITQLIQETVDSRTEAAKHKSMLKVKGTTVVLDDKETMTEIIELTPDVPSSSAHPDPPRTNSSAYMPSSPKYDMLTVPRNFSNEISCQLQAYQNEAFIWRSKAAQLEVVLKGELVKSKQTDLEAELIMYKSECERLRTAMELGTSTVSAHGNDSSGNLKLDNDVLISNDYYQSSSEEQRRALADENNKLMDRVDELTIKLNNFNQNLLHLRQSLRVTEEENERYVTRIDNMGKEIEEKSAEAQAASMKLQRLQNELTTKCKAICYLEERHQAYRNVIMDNNLIVGDESTSEWRHGFSDPRYVVNLSKRIQTDLTSNDLSMNEEKFTNLADQYEELNEEYSRSKTEMRRRCDEIESTLHSKATLIETLTEQMRESDREALRCIEKHQQDRERYESSVAELSRTVQKIPLLEFELEQCQQERSLFELKLRSAKDEFEDGLDAALNECLKKYKEQAAYWAEKIASVNDCKDNLLKEKLQLQGELEALRMRAKIEKADMACRLTSSIDHVAFLNRQINCETCDIEVDVRPRVANKYVACKPNVRHKMTEIGRGDLFDEYEERLKLCQGELAATRHQVEVLQQKLIYSFKEREDQEERSHVMDKLVENVRNEEVTRVVEEFDKRKTELDQEIRQYENERNELKNELAALKSEKQFYRDFVSARSSIRRTPSNTGMSCMTNGVTIIMADEYDRAEETSSLKRRCLSVPEISLMDRFSGYVNTMCERNSALVRANSELNKDLVALRDKIEVSMKRTASKSNFLSTNDENFEKHQSELPIEFTDLATDLNQVRIDLENILFQFETTEAQKKSEERVLQSGVDFKKASTSTSETNEVDCLRRSLKHSQSERDDLHGQLDRITIEFQDVLRELELYRHELRSEVTNQIPQLERSRSFAETGRATIDLDEYKRWVDKAGTMFRELNRIRKEYSECHAERHELQAELAIIRGELSLANCQLAEASTKKMSSSADFDEFHGYLNPCTTKDTSTDAISRNSRSNRFEPSSWSNLEQRSSSSQINDIAAYSEPNLHTTDEWTSDSYDFSAQRNFLKTSMRRASFKTDRISRLENSPRRCGFKLNTNFIFQNGRHREDSRWRNLRGSNSACLRKEEVLKLFDGSTAIGNQMERQEQRIEYESRIALLSKQNEVFINKLDEMEKERQDMYLVMFKKGKEAAEHDIHEEKILDEMTEDRIILRFLHDAFYNYLLNKGNSKDHLQAIMTLLNFTKRQKSEVRQQHGKSN